MADSAQEDHQVPARRGLRAGVLVAALSGLALTLAAILIGVLPPEGGSFIVGDFLLVRSVPWLIALGLLSFAVALFAARALSAPAGAFSLLGGVLLVVAAGVFGIVGSLFAASDVTRIVVDGCITPVIVEEELGGVGTVWLVGGIVARPVETTRTNGSHHPFVSGNYRAELDGERLSVTYGRSSADVVADNITARANLHVALAGSGPLRCD